MARKQKVEVAAINIRIPSSKLRNYVLLIEELRNLRRGIRVYGDSFVAITAFNPKNLRGALTKYTEIKTNGQWFDLESFDIAVPERVQEISIPNSLRPNSSSFEFLLDESLHTLVFESYAESKSLSVRAVLNYFRGIFLDDSMCRKFGKVEADILKSHDEVDRMLDLPDLREVKITIRRPNSDDLGNKLYTIIERRMEEENGDEYVQTVKSDTEALDPSKETRALAHVAAQNGEIAVKSIINGAMVRQNTSDAPLVRTTVFDPNLFGANTIFLKLAALIFDAVKQMRDRDGA